MCLGFQISITIVQKQLQVLQAKYFNIKASEDLAPAHLFLLLVIVFNQLKGGALTALFSGLWGAFSKSLSQQLKYKKLKLCFCNFIVQLNYKAPAKSHESWIKKKKTRKKYWNLMLITAVYVSSHKSYT